MKHNNLLFPLLFPLLGIITSCSTSSVTLTVLVPGQVAVTQDIKNVGIVNRSLPSQNDKVVNVLEGLFTGETIFGDREGSMQCISGLATKLNDSPRFNAVGIEGLDLRGTGIRQFPPPLAWNEVRDYCKRFNVDGLIVLELFDSDIRLEQGEREVEKEVNKQKVKVKEYWAEADINVNAGWRGYDPFSQSFFDQDIYTDSKSFSATGETPQKALQNLPDKRHAVNEAAYNAGLQYAFRISPTWMDVRRQYYKKGHQLFEMADRYVVTKEWDKAEMVWQKAAKDSIPEIAGKAYFNLALAEEIKGELGAAADYAKKSYQDYGNKKALGYLNRLEQRIEDQRRLKEQME
jgi:hypothetical protein